MQFWAKEICFMGISWLSLCILEEKIPEDDFQDGHPVAHEHFPFIVSLQEWGERWEHICVGNVVDQRNVLTAWQCVERANNSVERRPKDVANLRVYAGAGDMERGSALEQYIMVRNITAHSGVSPEANETSDLAMLHLARDLEFNSETLPMNLPASDTTAHSKALCYSPGWGKQWGAPDITLNLTLVECRRIPVPQCTNVLCQLFAMCSENLHKQGRTCALSSKLTSCFTELGSPLVCHGFVYGIATLKAGLNSPIIFAGLKPILEMVQGLNGTECPPMRAENGTQRTSQALEDKKRLEKWMQMLSSSQVHQATIIIVLECLLALRA